MSLEQESNATSPLSEVEKDSLSELFQRDPLELSEQDLTRIVETLRGQRKLWLQAESVPKAPRGKAKASGPGLSAAELDSLLNDI